MAALGRDRLKNRIERYWNWRSESYELDRAKSIETVENWNPLSMIWSPMSGAKTLVPLMSGQVLGSWHFTLHRRGFKVTGIDISPAMISRARLKADELGLCVDFRTGDAGKSSL